MVALGLLPRPRGYAIRCPIRSWGLLSSQHRNFYRFKNYTNTIALHFNNGGETISRDYYEQYTKALVALVDR